MQAHFIQLDGHRFHYLHSGQRDAPLLLLLHGTAMDSAMLTYGQHIPHFAEQFQVIALDWLGYGKSDKPLLDYSTRRYSHWLAQFIHALLQQKQREQLSIVAFSMGGAIALDYTLAHPGRVSKLVLVNSYGLSARIHVPLVPYLGLHTPRVAPGLWHWLQRSPNWLRRMMGIFVFADRRKITEPVLEAVREQFEDEGLRYAFFSWLRSEIGWRRLRSSYAQRLRGLEPPTLLIHGAGDWIIPASNARQAARQLPQAQLHIIPACGHWTPQEAPEAFRRAALGFLAG